MQAAGRFVRAHWPARYIGVETTGSRRGSLIRPRTTRAATAARITHTARGPERRERLEGLEGSLDGRPISAGLAPRLPFLLRSRFPPPVQPFQPVPPIQSTVTASVTAPAIASGYTTR